MFSKVYGGGLRGINGYLVQVEADVGDGLPQFHLVGYLASEVREAEERVRRAIRNSRQRLEPRRITVNLSPAHIRKEGTGFDLPIAAAVLAAYGIIGGNILKESAFIGELGLDGRIKPVRGVLPLVLAMEDAGMRRCFLPQENIPEGLAAERMDIVGVQDLKQVIELLKHPDQIRPEQPSITHIGREENVYPVDFSDIGGQELARRATEIAVAGQHNILYIGRPGSGKSMIARRIPTIMPCLSREEQLEISKVYSICGLLPEDHTLMTTRPFRSPHHTITPRAMVGGGTSPRPGEFSLASRGVLFLDELPEFGRASLEVLRQPLEERRIVISRIHGACEFPARFMLAAAMNPCPCGYYPDRNRCSCTEMEVRKYLGRISRPLLDRIDICVETAAVTYENIRDGGNGENSATIRDRVEASRQIQKKRFQGSALLFNSEMTGADVKHFCPLGNEEEDFLRQVYQKMELSARACERILKVARTIADLEGGGPITRAHLSEAASYRGFEEKYWGRSDTRYGNKG